MIGGVQIRLSRELCLVTEVRSTWIGRTFALSADQTATGLWRCDQLIVKQTNRCLKVEHFRHRPYSRFIVG